MDSMFRHGDRWRVCRANFREDGRTLPKVCVSDVWLNARSAAESGMTWLITQ